MHPHDLARLDRIDKQLGRLERAVELICTVLKIEEYQIERLEREVRPNHYPATFGMRIERIS